MLQLLHAVTPLLSNATFEAALKHLQDVLITQHNVREACEVAQHTEHEAHEDYCDTEQTFQGQFGATKLKEVLHMLDLQSSDDLPQVLHDLGKNKKKANDSWILQATIDHRVIAPTCITNEFMKLQLSNHIMDKFQSYTWVAIGD